MKETRYTIQTTVEQGGLIVDQTTVSLKWRKESPTKPGVYQVKFVSTDGTKETFWVKVSRFNDELSAFMFKYYEPIKLSMFTEWLGPFPTHGEQE